LNLNIRRIVFNSIFKSNGDEIVRLVHSDVKQIAGRAGRRNSQYPIGEVTCRDPRDLEYVRKCMLTEIEPITKAGLMPTSAHMERFASALQTFNEDEDLRSLSSVLEQFDEMSTIHGDFFLCGKGSTKIVSKWMEDLPLSITEKFIIR
jgi:ATP-dependent RNA helicase SUPV3L1/SUV3